MPIDAANISSGIGTGEAQVFTPYESKYGAEVARIKGAQQKAQQDKEEDIYKDLGKINAQGIFFKHQPIFAQKQSDLYNWTKENIDKLRKGDPNTTIEFHQKLTQLGSDIGESKNVAQSYRDAGLDYAKNPDKYRPEVLDKLHGFEGYNKETGQFENVDPSIMQQTLDLNKYTRENVAPMLRDKIEKGTIATPLGGGVISTVETQNLPEEIKRQEAKNAITDPHVYEEIHYQMKKQNPDKEPTNDDIANYYYENHLKDLFPDITKKHLTAGFSPSGLAATKVTISEPQKVSFTDVPFENDATSSFERRSITVGNKNIPPNTFQKPDGSYIQGIPTGDLYKKNTTGEISTTVKVPTKSLALPTGFSDMKPEEQAQALEALYIQQPDKFKVESVPVSTNKYNKAQIEKLGVPLEKIFEGKGVKTKKASVSDRHQKAIDDLKKEQGGKISQAQIDWIKAQ